MFVFLTAPLCFFDRSGAFNYACRAGIYRERRFSFSPELHNEILQFLLITSTFTPTPLPPSSLTCDRTSQSDARRSQKEVQFIIKTVNIYKINSSIWHNYKPSGLYRMFSLYDGSFRLRLSHKSTTHIFRKCYQMESVCVFVIVIYFSGLSPRGFLSFEAAGGEEEEEEEEGGMRHRYAAL